MIPISSTSSAVHSPRPLGVREFDRLSFDEIPEVRSYWIPDPVFGAVVFVGVVVETGVVEIADFDDDPDYWTQLENDPDD